MAAEQQLRRTDLEGVGVCRACDLHVRIRRVLGLTCGSVIEDGSVCVSNMKTGTLRSVRIKSLLGPFPDLIEAPLSWTPPPPLLWMKMPSKACVTGCKASAKVVRK